MLIEQLNKLIRKSVAMASSMPGFGSEFTNTGTFADFTRGPTEPSLAQEYVFHISTS